MLEGGKGETVFEAREGVIRLVYVLDLTCTLKVGDHLIRGVDGLNTLMRGVNKDDFLAVDRKTLNFPAFSLDILQTVRPSTHPINLTFHNNYSRKI